MSFDPALAGKYNPDAPKLYHADEYGPSVVQGVIIFITSSQFTSFDDDQYAGCERKWWYGAVGGKTWEGGSAATRQGTKSHGELEHYLKTGEDVLGDVVRPGIRFVPPPRHPAYFIEHTFGLRPPELHLGDVPVIGQIDVLNTSGTYVDKNGDTQKDPDGTVEIRDWKTTSSIAHGKSGVQLGNTPQMLAYGNWAVRNVKHVDIRHLRLSHGYFGTKKREAKLSTALFPVETVKERWYNLIPVVERMKVAARATRPEDVKPNFASCNAYVVGCPHRAYCPRTTEQATFDFFGAGSSSYGVLKGNDDMGLMDRLNARTTTPAPNGTAPPVAPASLPPVAPVIPVPGAAEFAARKAKMLADLEAEEKAATAPAATVIPAPPAVAAPAVAAAPAAPAVVEFYGMCPACSAPVTSLVGSRYPDGKYSHIGCPVMTSAPRTESPRVSVIPPDENKAAPTAQPTAGSSALDRANDVVPGTTIPVVAAPPVTTAPPAKRRGRPPGTKNATPSAPAGGLANNPRPGDSEVLATAESIAHLEHEYAGPFALYVDCMPRDGARSLDAYVTEKTTAMEAHYKCVDIRAAAPEGPLGFGRWKGVLAALVKSEPPEAGEWYLMGVKGSEVKATIADALESIAEQFVRGF